MSQGERAPTFDVVVSRYSNGSWEPRRGTDATPSTPSGDAHEPRRVAVPALRRVPVLEDQPEIWRRLEHHSGDPTGNEGIGEAHLLSARGRAILHQMPPNLPHIVGGSSPSAPTSEPPGHGP